MEETGSPKSLMAQVAAQAEVLVPVLRALRQELGKERAETIVFGALRGWLDATMAEIGQRLPGSPCTRWRILTHALEERIGDDVSSEKLRDDEQALELDVTRCRYADYFRQLGEPELGHAMVCDADFATVRAVGHPEVELLRTGTIMTGAERCDFRYRFTRS